ncbi:hypothetical protein M885DRAFT_620964 [Pelagophyceae sp. CCMP2097]|nr:hypothetical protein M885DRAFT_620964 [Pelagophyceae sp. CCMP2097]
MAALALRREESPLLDPNLLLGIDTPDIAQAKEIVRAGREGDYEPLRQLLQKSSQEIKDVLTAPIKHDEIVLRELVKFDVAEAVRMLLEGHPACVNYRRQSNNTGPLHEAFHKANKRMIVELIGHGANVCARSDPGGFNVLHNLVCGAEARRAGAAPYQLFEGLINEGVLSADDVADLTNEAGLPTRIGGYLQKHAQDADVACILERLGLPQVVLTVPADQPPLSRDTAYEVASHALETFKKDRSTAAGVRVLSMAASSAGAPLSLAKVKHLRYNFTGDFRAIVVPSCAAYEDFDKYCTRVFGHLTATLGSCNPAATSGTLRTLNLECKAWSIKPPRDLKISHYCRCDEASGQDAKKRDFSVQYLTVFQKVNGKRKASSLPEG